MRGIAVLSSKGGVGKSSIAHLFALGAAWRGKQAYVFHTDDREPLQTNERPYALIDGRDPARLETVILSLLDSSGFCVIDGGGNRSSFDRRISKAVDLAVVPVIADEEAVTLAIETMRQLQGEGANARYLLNMVSTNRRELEYDERRFFSRLDPDLVIGKVRRASAIRRLREPDGNEPFQTPETIINRLARRLHDDIDAAIALGDAIAA